MFQTKFLSQDVQMPQYLQQPSQVIKHFLDIKKKNTNFNCCLSASRITHEILMF